MTATSRPANVEGRHLSVSVRARARTLRLYEINAEALRKLVHEQSLAIRGFNSVMVVWLCRTSFVERDHPRSVFGPHLSSS